MANNSDAVKAVLSSLPTPNVQVPTAPTQGGGIDIGRLAKYALAGVGEIPSIPAGLLGMGNSLADIGNKYLPQDFRQGVEEVRNAILPAGAADVAHAISAKAGDIDEWWKGAVRGLLGLQKSDPTDLPAQSAELAGSIFTPGGIERLAPKVGGVIRDLAMVPKSLIGQGIFMGIGTGANALVDSMSAPPKPEGTSLSDLITNQYGVPSVPKPADKVNEVMGHLNDNIQTNVDGMSVRDVPSQVIASVMAKAGKVQGDAQYKMQQQIDGTDSQQWQVPTWMYVAGGLAAAVVGAKALGGPKLFELGEKFGPNAVEKSSLLSKVDALAAGQVDKNLPITKVARKAGNEHLANYVDTTQAAGTTRAAVDSLFTTGTFADAPNINVPKLMELANQFTGFNPEEQQLLASAIQAKDKLSYYKYFPSKGISGGDTVESLKDLVGSAEMHPEMKPFMQQYKQFTDGWANYLKQMGVLDADAATRYTSADNFYMPNIVQEGKSFKFLDGWLPTPKNDSYLGSPSSLLSRDTIPDDLKVLDPIRALEQYSLGMMDYARHNYIRRNFVDTMMGLKVAGSKEFGELVSKADKPGAGAIPVRRDGKIEYWNVKNRFVKQALEFQPQQIDGLLGAMNKVRHGFQFLTTGHGNPFAAPANFLYDAIGSAFLSDAGRPLGAFKGDIFGSTVRSLGGAYAGIKDRLAKQAYSYLNYAMNNDGVLNSVLGPETVNRLAAKAGDAWQNSVTQMMEKYGASHGGLATDDTIYSRMESVLSDITPEFTSKVPHARRVYNLYASVLDGIQSGARTAYWQKYGKLAKDYQSIVRDAYQTRNLVGDFAKFGNSPWSQALRSLIPYYNPSVQSIARIGKQFGKSPARMTAAIVGGALFPAAAAQLWMTTASPDHAQWFLNDLSPYERDAYLWLPSVDVQTSIEQGQIAYHAPQESLGIPLMPELRPLVAMVRSLVAELSGVDATLSRSEQSRPSREQANLLDSLSDLFGLPGSRSQQDLTQALMQSLPLGTPPLIQAGANALYGKDIASFGAFQMSDVKADPYNESGTDARLRTAIGNILGWTGQFAMQIAGAYNKSKPGTGIDNAIQQGEIQLGQKLPIVAGPMFGYQRKASASTVDANIYYSKMHAIEGIQKEFAAAQQQLQGRIGPQANPQMMMGMLPSMVQDPQQLAAMQLVARYGGMLDKLKSNVSKYKSLIDTTNARLDIGPHQKASIVNLATLREHQAQNEVVRFVQSQIEGQLSKMAGKQTFVEDLGSRERLQ